MGLGKQKIALAALFVLFAASTIASNAAETDCNARLNAVVDAGLRNNFFAPSHLISGSLPEPLAVLKDLFAYTIEEASMITGPELVNAALKSLNCKLPLDAGVDGTALQLNLTEWSQLSSFMIDLYDYTEASESAPVKRDVVVAGAGPIGLLHALEARALGSRVTVIEKRTSYVRNVWFDLGPEAWFDTLAHLQSIGVLRLSFEHVIQYTDDRRSAKGQVITIRCKELETTLAKVAFIVGIDLRFGVTFCGTDALESGTERLVAIVGQDCSASEKVHLPYDLLLASDGSNSKVRQSVFLAYGEHNAFLIDSKIHMRIFDLKQPTLLLNLKPESDGQCRAPKSASADSFEVGNTVPGVTHIFKRFYLGHCHLQILFTHEFATKHFPKNDVAALDRENTLPWPTILEIANAVFAVPFESVVTFKESIITIENDAENGVGGQKSILDVQYFQIAIKKTNHALFRPQLGPSKKPSSIVAIVGDASITAHYRLGIGINNGVRQIADVTHKALMLPSFADDSDITNIDNLELERLHHLANFEAYLIAAEAFCDYVVSFNLAKPLFSHSTYLRSRSTKGAELVQLSGMDTLTSCQAFSG